MARFVGAPVVEVETHEGDRAAYRANGPDRCFHCKDELFTRIDDEVVAAHRLDAVAYGENADDAPPARPAGRPGGHRAPGAAPAGRRRAGQGRRTAASPGRSDLPSADKPAAPCLASRIPHFEPRSPRRSCGQIERAEAALRRLGFADCGCATTATSPGSSCRADDLVRAPSTEPLRGRRSAHAVRAAGFRLRDASTWPGMQSGAFTLPLVHGAIHG